MNNSFMIAATGSGCGKTYITCGLLEALKGRGEVRAFKCGPDYIDPMFHKNVLGIPSKNLDLFFVDRDTVKKLFMMSSDGDISVVEGVMGLYDGMTPYSDEASSYDLASALDIPVILVIDAKGMARSLIALIKGFLEMDREKRIAGIILNRMSAGYYSTIKTVIENELGVEVFGYLPEKKEISFESRYLGLKLPSEVEDLRGKVSILAEEMNKTMKEIELKKIKLKDLKQKQKEEEITILKEKQKTEERQDKERQKIFDKINYNMNKFIIRNAEEIVAKNRQEQQKEEEKIQFYIEEKRKAMEEKEIREKIRKKKEKLELKKFLDMQVEEKKKEKTFLKELEHEQARIWNIDVQKYNEDSKMIDNKYKMMKKKNFEYILKQMKENDEKKIIKHNCDMTNDEYEMNKELLKQAKKSFLNEEKNK